MPCYTIGPVRNVIGTVDEEPYSGKPQCSLFQNGARGHESEAKGARFREIIIDHTTRERFLNIFAKFLVEKDISFAYGQFETAKDKIYG